MTREKRGHLLDGRQWSCQVILENILLVYRTIGRDNDKFVEGQEMRFQLYVIL